MSYLPDNNFDPDTGRLVLVLPLPPPDNHCHASGQYGRYPTKAYKDWLGIAGPMLAEVLGDWQPDTAQWWVVTGTLWLGSQGDGPNYLKATLDLLSGAQIKADNPRKGSIVKPGALWDDDRRVTVGFWMPAWLRHPDPCVMLHVEPCQDPLLLPRDWRVEEAAAAARVRGEAREQARRDREAAKATKPSRRKAGVV